MPYKRITTTEDPLFQKFWQIYTESFAYIERRDIELQQTAFTSPFYRLDVYLKKSEVAGFMGYWIFNQYIYVEHFAIARNQQGTGKGTLMMKTLQQQTKKIILLEIEPVVDETTKRRWLFYEKLGFLKTPHFHLMPVYHPGDDPNVRLDVLSYPFVIDEALYNQYDRDMKSIVMVHAGR